MDRQIWVYADLNGRALLVGRLWARVVRGKESASFEYDASWLDNPDRFALEPALALTSGPFHTAPEKALFGAIGDSAPDRWGRVLMRRAERRRAEKLGQTPRTLMESDFLLAVNDFARQGALRFKLDPHGPFLGLGSDTSIPPLVDLSRLLFATERLLNDEEDDDDLGLLLAPGSSLGGARPKAAVLDHSDQLAIAKFPHMLDDYNQVAWEGVALSLAEKSAINVPQWRLENVNGKTVLIVQRFDRNGTQRIPFLSAMSLVGAADNEEHSYLEIADALRQFGADTKPDLIQLWRRIVFNILISNTDDHLRNHGFLSSGSRGWCLSPAYDLNPVPVDVRPRILTTAVDEFDATASIELALSTSSYYGLSLDQAKAIAREVAEGVSSWRSEAEQLGQSKQAIDRMTSAFEHEDAEKARRLG